MNSALTLTVFGLLIAVTLGVTWWAASRTRSAEDFYTTGRTIGGLQNGLAIAGDYLSASTFLGVAGLVFLMGVDSFVLLGATLVSFLPILYLFAERLRNTSEFTVGAVLAARFNEPAVRAAAALATLCVAGAYLVAQFVGASVIITQLTGISTTAAVIATGALMIVYVTFGGMLATTWIQIVKATLLITVGVLIAIGVLVQAGGNPFTLLRDAAAASPDGAAYLQPGLLLAPDEPVETISYFVTFALGSIALPHMLIRFFTVRTTTAARRSAAWAIGFIGSFYLVIVVVGLGARAYLGPGAEKQVGAGANFTAPAITEFVAGGPGSLLGGIALAVVSGVACVTILAVVAGLLISAAGAVAHDLWANRSGRAHDPKGEATVARLASVGIGVVAVVLTLALGSQLNITVLIGVALAVAASANLPSLACALFWPGFTTRGAVAGILVGLVSSVVLIALGPAVWPGDEPPFPYTYPVLVSIPLGLLGCWLGSVASGGATRGRYRALRFRAETGLALDGPTADELQPQPGRSADRARS
ncbi:solute symporter family protein [Pseudonocardia kunmingensis]|uniref:Cation/acetate symporter n=1 Tax=Pseudonocardia kunmingensis TaxID=630975 RepID=A0A543DP15_9PSEU|nr:cation acetate symporter [Pseudonocardia kunmingensis]TQM11071.1 cation/acetate symporter [Pseudonocardia kunmingensis]